MANFQIDYFVVLEDPPNVPVVSCERQLLVLLAYSQDVVGLESADIREWSVERAVISTETAGPQRRTPEEQSCRSVFDLLYILLQGTLLAEHALQIRGLLRERCLQSLDPLVLRLDRPREKPFVVLQEFDLLLHLLETRALVFRWVGPGG